jgi:uroporphyrinogen-III decarboxylase
MTERDRLLKVYRGETPDRVPFYLDLSHWFYQKHKVPFDLSVAVHEPEHDLLACHREFGAGFAIPNRISYFDVSYPAEIRPSVSHDQTARGVELTWTIETPLGVIRRKRLWHEGSYSWGISEWGIRGEQDLRVLGYALSRARFHPAWERYDCWREAVGEIGVPYLSIGYSATGQLLNYWMGIEETMFAAADMPGVLAEVVEEINANLLNLVDLVCQSPAEIVLLGDNFSSDIQSPRFLEKWSARFYRETFRRLHAAGKFAAVHVDGRMRGLLGAFASLGADCIDAVTPAPMGDLTARECREEAGHDLILSGGVPPSVWIEPASDDDFRRAVLDWLELRTLSARLIAAAGDQVPPGAPEHRIRMMRDLVEEFGRF